MVGVVKYFHLLGVLSALIFMLWGCCPILLFSILAFLCPPTWPHDENVDRPHLYHVMTRDGIVHLDGWSSKIFSSFGVLSALIFMALSYGAFVQFFFSLSPTWPHDENVDRPHLYHVITWPEMGSYTLMVGVVKYFHLLGVLSALIFILCCYCPMVLLSNFSFLCPPTWLHDENVDRRHLYHVITWSEMRSYTLMVGVVKYFHLLGVLSTLIFKLWGCCPMVLLSILGFLCPPTWPHDENVDRSHLYHVITWREIWSYTLMVGVVKYFHLLGVLSTLIFILWIYCRMVLLSNFSFLCPPTSLHDENVDHPHLYHVITWSEMETYTLMVGVVKYFHLLWVLSTLIFILWGCCPMVLLSIMAFLCLPTWPHDQNVDRPHLYRDHMTRDVIVHLDGWSSKIFSSFGGFVRLDFFLVWGCCPMVLLSILGFLCPPTWPHDENVDRPHLYHVITWPEMGSYTLMVGVVKYFHLLGVLSALIFILCCYCPMVLLSNFSFLCPPTWLHDENVDRPHLYHVITWPEMGSYTLMVGVVKYFHLLGVLSALIFILWGYCPMVLLSNFSFLCPPTWLHDENVDRPHLYHVITWPEMGSYTLMVGVGKYFHLLGVWPPWFLSFGSIVIWCFCPIFLFSVRPRDRMTRMLIVHTCIMWSHDQRWDRTPWWLE